MEWGTQFSDFALYDNGFGVIPTKIEMLITSLLYLDFNGSYIEVN